MTGVQTCALPIWGIDHHIMTAPQPGERQRLPLVGQHQLLQTGERVGQHTLTLAAWAWRCQMAAFFSMAPVESKRRVNEFNMAKIAKIAIFATCPTPFLSAVMQIRSCVSCRLCRRAS